ncbi:MAG: hypothetical protein ACLUFI_04385 [Oscillospiraceae bacterium]
MDLETLQAAQQAAATVIRGAESLDAPELAPSKPASRPCSPARRSA